ncbi:MAG: hypothetical protein JO290_06370 [Sphingomonadaceae bacterium]|nr:hypothetical protein [Sphingomonadaceae bacterium]
MTRLRLILVFFIALLAGGYADAQTPLVPATAPVACTALPAAFKAAHAGAAFVVTGTCTAVVELRDRIFAPPVTIDARGAVFQGGLLIFKAGGVHVTGGQYGPQDRGGTGFEAYLATDVTLIAARVTGMDFGVAFAQAQNVAVTGSRIDPVRNDGIRFFSVQHGLASGNYVLEAHPATSLDHPDCLQIASDGGATNPALISADIVVTGNECYGDGQGFSAFKSGSDDGGYDRLTLTSNRARMSYPLGMAIYGCRDCTIRDNDINALPLAAKTVQANVIDPVGGTICGNRTPRPTDATAAACAAPVRP